VIAQDVVELDKAPGFLQLQLSFPGQRDPLRSARCELVIARLRVEL
jgi:hypothetical protein